MTCSFCGAKGVKLDAINYGGKLVMRCISCKVLDGVQAMGFPKRVPLTEEVLNKLWGGFSDDMNRQQAMSFARAIERAHEIGEKE
jgi:hypothetical protein